MSRPQILRSTVRASYGRIARHAESFGDWLSGDVVTRYGIVSVCSQGERFPHSRYDFCHGERHYMKTERRQRTKRGLAIMATRFAKEVIEGRHD